MQLDHTHLKVDQTLLHHNETYLLVSNINIPEGEFHQLDAVLDRAQHFIQQDYADALGDNIHYQVCATYELQNTNTGETRHWSGSFNPKGNTFNTLSNFARYLPATFKPIVKHACSPQNIYNRLRFFHAHTAWVFRQFTSAIISVQAKVNVNNEAVQRRGHLHPRNRIHERVHVTFHLA
jgi:hypothetical protein